MTCNCLLELRADDPYCNAEVRCDLKAKHPGPHSGTVKDIQGRNVTVSWEYWPLPTSHD